MGKNPQHSTKAHTVCYLLGKKQWRKKCVSLQKETQGGLTTKHWSWLPTRKHGRTGWKENGIFGDNSLSLWVILIFESKLTFYILKNKIKQECEGEGAITKNNLKQ